MTTTVYKQLASMQDLNLGKGTEVQQRNGNAVTVDKVNIAYVFDTVADMVAGTPATVKLGSVVQTSGYTTAGDGGGKHYLVVAAATGTADGSNFIDLAVHQAKSISISKTELAAAAGGGLVGYGSTTVESFLDALALAKATRTTEAKTWYVATTGNDSTGDGSVGNPFATLQAAWDAMPQIILHEQVIQLADGTYSSSTIAAVDQPRPAILWGRGKITTFRTWVASLTMRGPITIQGNAADPSLVKLVNVGAYTYNVYINKGNVGLQHLSIESGVAGTLALVVAHRTDTFVHLYNCIIDGKNTTTSGMNAESSGQIEFVQGVAGEIKNCVNGAQALSAGDSITIGSQGSSVIKSCGTGVVAVSNSYIGLFSAQPGNGKVEVIDSTCTLGINATFNAMVQVRGADFGTDMAQIGAPCVIESGAHLEFIFAESLAGVTVKNASVKYNASNYADFVLAYDSSVHLETSNSYVSPATANLNARPIQLLADSTIFKEGTNNINGSSGIVVPTRWPSALTFSANNQTLTPVVNRYSVITVGSGNATGPHTGCEINSAGVTEGDILCVSYNAALTHNVQLIGTGTHMAFANPILIGKNVGDYTGATFQMVDSKWRLIGLGQLIS